MSSCFSLSVSTVASVWCFWIFSGLRNIVPEPNIKKRQDSTLSHTHTHTSQNHFKKILWEGGREREGWGPGIPVPQLDFGNFDHQSTSSLCKINSCELLYFQVCYTQLIGVLVSFVWWWSVYYFPIFKSMIFRYFHLVSWVDLINQLMRHCTCTNITKVRVQFLIRPEFSAWSSLSVV